MSSLLEGVRGMSISEQGSVAVPPPEEKAQKKERKERSENKASVATRSAAPTDVMSDEPQAGGAADGRKSPDLTGIGEMFDR